MLPGPPFGTGRYHNILSAMKQQSPIREYNSQLEEQTAAIAGHECLAPDPVLLYDGRGAIAK
jgi:hypothetical protein